MDMTPTVAVSMMLVGALSGLAQSRKVTKPTSAAAAPPVPISYGGHALRETLVEWLKGFNIDVEAACEQHAPEAVKAVESLTDANKYRNDAVFMAHDPFLEATLLKNAEDRVNSVVQIVCSSIKRVQQTGAGEIRTRKEPLDVDYGFLDGRLAKVIISGKETLEDFSIDQQLRFLIQRYGKPTLSQKKIYQNGFGATWECPEYTWLLKTGVILLWESIIQADRDLSVMLSTGEEKPKPVGPNPY